MCHMCDFVINHATISLAWEIFFILHDNTSNSWCIVLNMAYKAFITYPACGATIPCSQKLNFLSYFPGTKHTLNSIEKFVMSF